MLADRMRMAAGGRKRLDEYTKSLLHFDGSNDSTIFKDETGKIWTRSGNSKISTAYSKFGGSSAYFDGTGDFIYTPKHEDFNFGGGAFTIDFWIKSVATDDSFKWIFGAWPYVALRIDGVNNSLVLSVGASSSSPFGALSRDWHHCALVGSTKNVSAYVDGTFLRSVAGTPPDLADILEIGGISGYESGMNNFYGYIDEFRVSKGIARWTSNFTPPTKAY